MRELLERQVDPVAPIELELVAGPAPTRRRTGRSVGALLVLAALVVGTALARAPRESRGPSEKVTTLPDGGAEPGESPFTMSWSETREVTGPDHPAAVWPRADRDGLVKELAKRADAGDPLPKDPSALALVFARDVLRWTDPSVSSIVKSSDGGWVVSVPSPAAVRALQPAQIWIVRLEGTDSLVVWYFNLRWRPETTLSVNLFELGRSDSVFTNASIPGTTAELTVRYGDHTVTRSSTDGEVGWTFRFGPDAGLPGSLLVILRDASGAAVQGIGTALPAGPIAAS
jgi:hypothetical protein